MKKLIALTIFSLGTLMSFSQRNSKISIEANYGLDGNFFVRSYDEYSGPPPAASFNNKNFIGTIGGLEVRYNFNRKASMGVAYARSVNSKEVNYSGGLSSGTYLGIEDFKIRHTNNFYQFYYERQLNKGLSRLAANSGLFYLRMSQQEVTIGTRNLSFGERNFKNSRLEEGGAFFGLQYSVKIDTKFDLGIESRVYYLLSTGTWEAVSLTPTLTYNFK